jgi:hypothetical protein
VVVVSVRRELLLLLSETRCFAEDEESAAVDLRRESEGEIDRERLAIRLGRERECERCLELEAGEERVAFDELDFFSFLCADWWCELFLLDEDFFFFFLEDFFFEERC